MLSICNLKSTRQKLPLTSRPNLQLLQTSNNTNTPWLVLLVVSFTIPLDVLLVEKLQLEGHGCLQSTFLAQSFWISDLAAAFSFVCIAICNLKSTHKNYPAAPNLQLLQTSNDTNKPWLILLVVSYTIPLDLLLYHVPFLSFSLPLMSFSFRFCSLHVLFFPFIFLSFFFLSFHSPFMSFSFISF